MKLPKPKYCLYASGSGDNARQCARKAVVTFQTKSNLKWTRCEEHAQVEAESNFAFVTGVAWAVSDDERDRWEAEIIRAVLARGIDNDSPATQRETKESMATIGTAVHLALQAAFGKKAK